MFLIIHTSIPDFLLSPHILWTIKETETGSFGLWTAFYRYGGRRRKGSEWFPLPFSRIGFPGEVESLIYLVEPNPVPSANQKLIWMEWNSFWSRTELSRSGLAWMDGWMDGWLLCGRMKWKESVVAGSVVPEKLTKSFHGTDWLDGSLTELL